MGITHFAEMPDVNELDAFSAASVVFYFRSIYCFFALSGQPLSNKLLVTTQFWIATALDTTYADPMPTSLYFVDNVSISLMKYRAKC
jgi:hypothetical protein